MANVILVFPSNSNTMIATKALRDRGLAATMIPKPAAVQSPANLCLSIEGGIEAAALAALHAAKVSITSVVR